MSKYKKYIIPLIAMVLFLGWSNDTSQNTPVCTAQGDQMYPQIISGDFGSTIITWQDSRGEDSDIYAQYLDALGQARWKRNGIPICRLEGDQEKPLIVSDGAGGAIIAWFDKRGGNKGKIYAQRVDASGRLRWASNGIPICNLESNKSQLKVISDGLGGAVFSWRDNREGDGYGLFAQRINSRGNVYWVVNGIKLFKVDDVASSNWVYEPPWYHDLVMDGEAGVVFVFGHYAQYLDLSGTSMWIIDFCTYDSGKSEPKIVPGNPGEFIIAWVDDREDYYSGYYNYENLYSQRINRYGDILCSIGGVSEYFDYSWLSDLHMIPAGSGGAYIAWTDVYYDSMERCSYYFTGYIYLSPGCGDELVFKGEKLHRSLSFMPRRKNPRIVSNGAGGSIFSWTDNRNGNYDIYVSYRPTHAKDYWSGPVSTGEADTVSHEMVGDGAGGAVVTWAEKRNGNYDIYAQNVCSTGGVGDCSFPVALIEGQKFGGMAPAEITFDGSSSYDPDGKIKRWRWDFGDGETGNGSQITHTYHTPGIYWASLWVKDNHGKWSTAAKVPVMVFAYGDIETKLNIETGVVKAYGKELVGVRAACYELATDPDREERAIPVDLGLQLMVDAGSWQGEQLFSSGYYYRRLLSGQPGTATIKAMLEGKVMAQTTVEFAWPQAPVNVQVELKENRGLFRGEYYAHISWQANPAEVFTPAHYRVYRSENAGSFQLTGEVDAQTFNFIDTGLSIEKEYSFVVTMVDEEGDESEPSLGTKRN